MIDEAMPVVVLATNISAYDKIISNIQEVKARKGRIIAIVSEGDEVIKKLVSNDWKEPDAENKLKKTYKNRYFIQQTGSKKD